MSGPIQHLDPSTYERHLIHGDGRTWAETNCYVDVLVELLHGLRFEPIAALPFTLRIDFEGDQWTFFKFPQDDLLNLFGLDIQELNPWKVTGSSCRPPSNAGTSSLGGVGLLLSPGHRGHGL